MPKTVDKAQFTREVQVQAARGLKNEEIAEVIGVPKAVMMRRMTRYGFRYHQAPGQWVPKENGGVPA